METVINYMTSNVEPPGPLEINWWTDSDIRHLVDQLANATGVDVYGQEDSHTLDRAGLVDRLRSLAQIIAEANITPVRFVCVACGGRGSYNDDGADLPASHYTCRTCEGAGYTE